VSVGDVVAMGAAVGAGVSVAVGGADVGVAVGAGVAVRGLGVGVCKGAAVGDGRLGAGAAPHPATKSASNNKKDAKDINRCMKSGLTNKELKHFITEPKGIVQFCIAASLAVSRRSRHACGARP